MNQLNALQQVVIQRHTELEQAKEEAEQAGAGDTSLDSMSTEDLVEKMASTSIYAALSRDGTKKTPKKWPTFFLFLELRKIAAAALSETQKQRDRAQKKLQDAYSVIMNETHLIYIFSLKNYTMVQQTFQLQVMVLINANPQLAPIYLSQVTKNKEETLLRAFFS